MDIFEMPEISVMSVDTNSVYSSVEDRFPITPVGIDGFPLTEI